MQGVNRDRYARFTTGVQNARCILACNGVGLKRQKARALAATQNRNHADKRGKKGYDHV